MEVSRIHDDITQLLYKVEEQYSRIIQYRDTIPLIEIDLALRDMRDLYESFMDLRTVAEIHKRKSLGISSEIPATTPIAFSSPANSVNSTPTTAKVEPVVASKPSVEEVKVPEIIAEKKEEAKPEEKPEVVVEQKNEPIPEEKPVIITPETKEEVKPEPIVAAKPSTPVVPMPGAQPLVIAPKVDLLKERERDFVPTVRKIEFKPEPVSLGDAKKESIFEKAASLYDKIAKPGEKTVATQATRQPISNIRSSIGINEKFAYLKDLFKNNINEYNESLDKLNNFESYSDAEDFFQELKVRYNWDSEGKSFQGLADLLNRRYLHNV